MPDNINSGEISNMDKIEADLSTKRVAKQTVSPMVTFGGGLTDEEAVQRGTNHPHSAGAEAGVSIRDVCRTHNATEQTFFRWRNKYGGLDVSDARKLKSRESENAKLKRLVTEQLLVIDGLKEFSGRK